METVEWMNWIGSFIKVAEQGSFSKAAIELGISKSHVSKTIQKLESDLGIALFTRSTRNVQLTELGQIFLEKSKQSINDLQSAKKEILNFSESPRGILRVTSAGLFGEEIIAPVAIQLSKKYPDLKIELDFSTQIVDLIDKKFDIAIRFGPLKDSSLIAQKIATRREYVCASKKYFENHPLPRHPKELSQHNCIGTSGAWDFKIGSKNVKFNISGNFKSNNPRVIARSAIEGLGIAKLPGAYVFDEIRKGKLISILESYNEGKSDVWIVTPIKFEKSINTKVFIKALKSFLNENYKDVVF